MTTVTSATSTASQPSAVVGPAHYTRAETIDRLGTLAGDPALAGREAPLSSLAVALSDRDLADGWESVPLHAALGYPVPDDAELGGRTQKLLDFLGALRIGLVFVPVLVTWLGVYWAARFYHQELARDPELPAQSFFRLWLDGYDGRLPLTFHQMAMVIAVALLLLIILSMTIEMVRSTHEAAAAVRRHALQDELNRVLTAASVYLARGRRSAPEVFLEELTRTAEGLTSVAEQVRSAATAAAEAMQAATVATAAAGEAATTARQGTSTLAESVNTLADSANRTESATTRLLDGVAAHTDTAAQAVTDAVRGSVGDFAGAVGDLQHAVDQVGARAAEDRDNLGRLLREHYGDLDRVLPDLAEQVATRQSATLDEHLSDLRDSIRGLAQEQAALAKAQQALATAVSRRSAARVASPPAPEATRGRWGQLRRFFGG